MPGYRASMHKAPALPGLLALLVLLALACDVSSILTAVVGTPTPLPTATAVLTATAAPPVNIVTNAVTSKDVSGDNVNPAGITDSFPADQSIFHVVVTISAAPANTILKVNWLTASNAPMGDFTLTTGGSRNLDFTFKPDAGKLPPGNYQAQVYVNGKLDRTLQFAVMPPASAKSPAVAPKPSGAIKSVTMAAATTGNNFDPANPTDIFKPSDIFHAVTMLSNAPANTKFTATWFVVDVGNAAAAGSKIGSTDITSDGSRNIDFRLSPATTWPAGTYRVEISVNDVVDTVKSFSVK